jgi:hypothetical protein
MTQSKRGKQAHKLSSETCLILGKSDLATLSNEMDGTQPLSV